MCIGLGRTLKASPSFKLGGGQANIIASLVPMPLIACSFSILQAIINGGVEGLGMSLYNSPVGHYR